MLAADPFTFAVGASAGADLTLRMVDKLGTATFEIVDSSDPTTVLAERAVADTSEIVIDGSEFADSLTVQLTASDLGARLLTFNAGGGDDRLTLESVEFGGHFVNFNAGEGNDTVAGPDTGARWIVTGAGVGAVGDVLFGDVENLEGAAGADRFELAAAGSIAGSIDGGEGGDTLVGADVATDWLVSAANAGMSGGIAFANVEFLVGGADADRFSLLDGGSLVTAIDGGGGADSLAGADSATSWTLSAANAGTAGAIVFTQIESLAGGSAADTFSLLDGGSVTGALAGGGGDDTLDFAAYGAAVTVDTASRTATSVGSFSDIENLVGSIFADVLIGPLDDTTWDITGVDSGRIAALAFVAFESLRGASGNRDTFVLGADGQLSGSLDGGAGGFDSLVIEGEYSTIAMEATGPDSGYMQLDSIRIAFEGLEPITVTGGTPTNVVLDLSTLDFLFLTSNDTATLGNGPGANQITFSGTTFESVTITKPTGSLSVNLGGGDDTLRLDAISLDATLSIAGGAGADRVVVAGDVTLPGGDLTIDAETIVVGPELVATAALPSNWATGAAYQGVATSTSNSGTGLTVDVVVSAGGVPSFVVAATGSGYNATETITVTEPGGTGTPVTLQLTPLVISTSDPVSPGDITLTGNTILLGAGTELIAGTAGVFGDVRLEVRDFKTSTFLGSGSNSRTATIALDDATIRAANISIVAESGDSVAGPVTFDVAADVNGALDQIDVGQPHGFATGTAVFYDTAGGTAATGLEDGKTYYVIEDAANPNVFGLADTIENALAGVRLNIGALGTSATHTLTPQGQVQDSWVIDALNRFVEGLAENFSLPAAVMIKRAESNITVGAGSQLTAANDVLISSSAVADATTEAITGGLLNGGIPIAQIFSVAFSKAEATARSTIANGATINASGNISVVSDSNATASATARTTRNLGLTGPVDKDALAFSLAITDADLTSLATIADGATLTAGRNVHVLAEGNVVDKASAETALYEDGLAGVAIAWQTGDAEVKATVAGTVTATGAGAGASFTLAPPGAAGSPFDIDADTINLGAAHGLRTGDPLIYEHNDATDIGGLRSGTVYFAIVDASDPGKIQLAATIEDARSGIAIDLDAQPVLLFGIGSDPINHTLTKVSGIGIRADLYSDDLSSAVSGSRGGPLVKDALLKGEVTPVLPVILAGKSAELRQAAGQSNLLDDTDYSIAGALAYANSKNVVVAKIDNTADVATNADLLLAAELTHRVQTAAESTIGQRADGEDAAFAVGLIIGGYNDAVQALIGDNADVDASGDIVVSAVTQYPFLTEPKALYSLDDLASQDAVGTLLDGKLGIQSKLFNSWGRAVGDGDRGGYAGTFNLMRFTTVAEAEIGDNALINQDAAYQTVAQDVSVRADTVFRLVNMAGVFDLNVQFTPGETPPWPPYGSGAASEQRALGASLLFLFMNNRTEARIGSGASVRAGSNGGVDVRAKSDIMNIALAQSGGKGGQFGFGGTFSFIDHDNVTRASVDGSATIRGKDLTVKAIDETSHVSLVGGVAKGEARGFGISVGLQFVDRTTQAYIGAEDRTDSATASVEVGGDVNVEAKSDGNINTFVLAASVQSEQPPTAQITDGDPLDGKELPVVGDEKGPMKSGLAVAGAGTANVVRETTEAFINTTAELHADNVTVKADSDTDIHSFTGGAAYTKRLTNAEKSTSIAGAFSLNDVVTTTRAAIYGADVRLTDSTADGNVKEVIVDARRTGTIWSFSGSGSGAVGPSANATSLAGSVSINTVTSTTEALVDKAHVRLAAQRDVDLIAKDTSEIVSVGGGVAFVSGPTAGKGVGASIGVNKINNTIRASASNGSTFGEAESRIGKLNVEASNAATIRSIAISAGLSNGLGLAGTIAVNLLSTNLIASLEGGSAYAAGDVVVKADDDSNIQSVSGAVGISTTKSGYGIAVAWNQIGGTTTAAIRGAALVDTSGNVNVEAVSRQSDPVVEAKIAAATIGVAASKETSLAGSVSFNIVDVDMVAEVAGGANVTAQQAVTVKADDQSTIKALAGGAGFSADGGFGAAIAESFILNSVRARVDSSRVSAKRDIAITALERATIDSLAIGLAGGKDFALGGSFSLGDIANTTEASVSGASVIDTDTNVTIAADDTATVNIKSGAVGGSAGSAVGIASSTIVTNNATRAIAGDGVTINARGNGATATTKGVTVQASQPVIANQNTRGLSVSATSRDDITNIAVAGSGSKDGALAGSVVVTVLNETTKAYIGDGAKINDYADKSTTGAGQRVSVLAADTTDVLSVAGGIAGSGSAGVGAGIDVGVIKKDTQAYIGAATVDARENVLVNAISSEDLNSISASLGAGGRAGVGGSVTTYTVLNTTRAFIGQAQYTVAPSAAGANWASGASYTNVAPTSQTGTGSGARASIGVDASGSPTLTLTALGSGYAVGDELTFADPAGTGDPLKVVVKAADVEADGSVVVLADDNTELDVFAGNVAIGGNVGAGAGLGVNVLNRTTEAFIGDASRVVARGAAGATAAYTGEFSEGSATAEATSTTPQELQLDANGDPTNRGAIEVRAPGDQTGGADLHPGTSDDASLTAPLSSKRVINRGVDASFSGVSVVAQSRDDVETLTFSLGGAGGLAVNVGGSVNVFTNNTTANIGSGARVTADNAGAAGAGSVLLGAASDTYHMGIAAAAGLGGTAVTPGVNVIVVNNATKAQVDDGAVVVAEKHVTINADASTAIREIAAGFAGAAGTAVGGAVNVIVVDNETYASIGKGGAGAKVAAGGNVLVDAADDTDILNLAGSLGAGLGAAGAGASVNVISISKDTQAFIGPASEVDAAAGVAESLSVAGDLAENGTVSRNNAFRGVAVQASSKEKVATAGAAAGFGSSAGLAGGVTVEVFDSDTYAYIGANARVNKQAGAAAEQGVNVSATNEVNALAFAGAVAGGSAGIGGGVDVGILRNDTSAFVTGGAQVSARSSVDVNAFSSRDVTSLAASAALGGGSLAGSVSVWLLGGQFNEQATTYQVEQRDEEGNVESTESRNSLNGAALLNTVNGSDGQGGGFSSILGAYSDKTAFLRSAVNASNDTIDLGSHGFTNGQRIVYRAGATPIEGLVDGHTYIVQVDSTNSNLVRLAASAADASDSKFVDLGVVGSSLDGHSFDTGVGAATADQKSEVDTSSTSGNTAGSLNESSSVKLTSGTNAKIAAGAVVTALDDVNVRAKDDVDMNIIAGSVAIGGAAAGISVGILGVASSTVANIDGQVSAGPSAGDDVLVVAALDADYRGRTIAGAVAAGPALGAQVLVFKDTSTQNAYIGAGARIDAAGGTINVQALADRNIDLDGIGGAVSLGVGIGATVAVIDVAGSTRAHVDAASIGQTAGSTVANLVVKADSDATGAGLDVDTIAIGGGIGAGVAGSVAIISFRPTVEAFIGDGALVTVDNAVTVVGSSAATADATAKGAALSLTVSGGASLAFATITPTVRSYAGAARITSRNGTITLRSQHNVAADGTTLLNTADTGATASAQSVSAALIAGAAGSISRAESSAVLDTRVASGATLTAGGGINLVAKAGNEADASSSGLGGGIVGIGVTISDAIVGGSTQARVLDGTAATHADLDALGGSVTIKADATSDASAITKALNGGVVALGLNTARATVTPAINAEVGQWTTIDASQNVDVTSLSAGLATADVQGTAVGLGLAMTGSKAVATLSPTVDAIVDSSARLDAGGAIGVSALHNVTDTTANTHLLGAGRQALATAVLSGGGLLSALKADADAIASATVRARLASGADLSANTGITVDARATNDASSSASGLSIGAVSLGAMDATSTIGSTTWAYVEDSTAANRATLDTAGGIAIVADSRDQAQSVAAATGGSLITGADATSTSNVTANVKASIGNYATGDGTAVFGADLAEASLTVNAKERTRSLATTTGKSISVGGAGSSVANATATPTVLAEIGHHTSFDVTGAVQVKASLNEGVSEEAAKVSVTSSSGTLLFDGGGTRGTATSTANVTAQLRNGVSGVGSELDAGTNIDVTAIANNLVTTDVRGDATGLISTGSVAGDANITTLANAIVGDDADLEAQVDIDVASVATSNANTIVRGGSGTTLSESLESLFSGDLGNVGVPSIFAASGAASTITANNVAATTVGRRSTLAALGTIDIDATGTLIATPDVRMQTSGVVAASATAYAAVTGNADAIVTIGDGAIIIGDVVDIDAHNVIDVRAFAEGFALVDVEGAFGTAITKVNLGSAANPSEARVSLGDASITGRTLLTIEATNTPTTPGQSILSHARGKAETNLFVGIAVANADGTVFTRATVESTDGTSLTSAELDVHAESTLALNRNPETISTTLITKTLSVVKTVTETVRREVCTWLPWPLDLLCEVVTDVITKVVTVLEDVLVAASSFPTQGGAGITSTDTINLNGDIYNIGAQDRLLIVNADGTLDASSNVGATVDGDSVLVDDIVADPKTKITFRVQRGQLLGDAILHVDKVIGHVDIRNYSNRDLVLQRIDMLGTDGPTTPDVSFQIGSGDHYEFDENLVNSRLDIANVLDGTNAGTASSDIIFTRSISNVTGAIEIDNDRGSIITQNADVYLEGGDVGHMRLQATGGNIGEAGDAFEVRLVRGKVAPGGGPADMPAELVAETSGNIWLELKGRNTQALATDTADGFALHLTGAQGIDVDITRSEVSRIVNLDTVVTNAAPGIYNIVRAESTNGNVDIAVAQTLSGSLILGPVTGFLGQGGIAVNQVTGVFGTIAAEANPGLVRAVGGTVRLTTAVSGFLRAGAGATQIEGTAAILNVGGDVGTAANPIKTKLDNLEANVGGSLWLRDTGALTIGGVSSLVGVAAGQAIDIGATGILTVAERVAGGTGNVTLRSDLDVALSSGIGVGSASGDAALIAVRDVAMANGSNVTTASGDARLIAGRNVAMTGTASANATTGDVIVDAGQDLNMATTARLTSASANVDVDAAQNVYLGLVTAGATADIEATTGSIADAAFDGTDHIVAAGLILRAGVNAGSSANPLETRVSRLEAVLGGGLWLDNTGDVAIGGISAINGIVASGVVDISAHSDITVNEAIVSGGGNVLLDASENIVTNASILSGGGNVVLDAEQNITTNGGITTGGGDVSLDAAIDLVVNGPITTSGGDVTLYGAEDVTINGAISSGGGLVLVLADQDVVVTASTPILSGGEDVSLTAGRDIVVNGSITTAGGLVDLDAVRDVAINGGISSGSGAIGLVAGQDITINAAVHSAGGTVSLAADRNIAFTSAGSLDADSGASTIALVADADLTNGGSIAMANGSFIDAADGLIDLLATGDITLSRLETTTDVRVETTSGSILDTSDGFGEEIVATNASLQANAGIGTLTNALETRVAYLEANASAGGIFIDDFGGLTIGSIVPTASPFAVLTGVSAYGNVVVSTTGAMRVEEQVSSQTGGVRLLTVDSAVPGEDFTLAANVAITAFEYVEIDAGDDALIDRGATIVVGDGVDGIIEITVDALNADAGVGGRLDLLGGLSAVTNVIAGYGDDDYFYLQPQSLSGHTQIFGDQVGQAGNDTVELDRLPTIAGLHDRPGHTRRDGTDGAVRDTVDVDGRAGADTYIVRVNGAAGTDYLVNVHDTGGDDGDELQIYGTDAADVFLIREHFVAYLTPTGGQTQDGAPEYADNVERINYDGGIDSRLFVSSGRGNDEFYLDDNSTETVLDGGDDVDTFQVGQVFGVDPNGYVANDDDGIDLTSTGDQIEVQPIVLGPGNDAYLSSGVSFDTDIFGGSGSDRFLVYSNKAELLVEGESGNDEFLIRAFVAEANIKTNGGDDDDSFEYNINAPVTVDGGLGFDTVVAVGTFIDDVFVITANGVSGAGLDVRLLGNEEALEIDGIEGDDTFIVLGTSDKVVTTIIGGLGSDTFNLGGTGGGLGQGTLAGIRGPVVIEGGVAVGRDRSLGFPVTLPSEVLPNGGAPAPDTNASAVVEEEQVDRLNVFNDSNDTAPAGYLTEAHLDNALISLSAPILLGGLGLGEQDLVLDISEAQDRTELVTFRAGVTFDDIEVTEILLGAGNDQFVVGATSIGTPGAAEQAAPSSVITVVHGGGGADNVVVTNNDALSAAVGDLSAGNTLVAAGDDDFIEMGLSVHELVELFDADGASLGFFEIEQVAATTLTLRGADLDVSAARSLERINRGGGGGASPLVIFGDTSQDGSRYQDGVEGAGASFAVHGGDTLDARASSLSVTIYGGQGDDTIYGSQAGDHLAGGSGDDEIHAEGGNDHVYGDSGFNLDYDVVKLPDGSASVARALTVPTAGAAGDVPNTSDALVAGEDDLFGDAGNDILLGDHGVIEQVAGTLRLTSTGDVIRVESTETANGADDFIDGGADHDLIIGSRGGDRLLGQAGSDLVFGDHGRVLARSSTVINLSSIASNAGPTFDYESIETEPQAAPDQAVAVATLGGNDWIEGDALDDAVGGSDILIGQQGTDTIFGGAGDDDIAGGQASNILDPALTQVAGGQDAGDFLDGGSGNDLIVGDNALFMRTGGAVDPRMRALTSTAIYGETQLMVFENGVWVDLTNDGEALVTDQAQANPDGVSVRTVVLLDHSDAHDVDTALTHGNDYIAGGADDDVIFGQLGDDTIQGDGGMSDGDGDGVIDIAVGASRNDAGYLTVDASFEAATDGDDYIEGNGGDDVIFGNLGQDDIIGGSSELYGLGGNEDLRPDGSDTIFGGAGTDIARNDAGDTHTADADVIVGDNANIYRLVGVNGTASNGFLTFNYDHYMATGGESRTLIPRAVDLLDYTPGGPDFDFAALANDNGASDEIHGESGDDAIYGMAGDDLLFGDAQDDDIIGGWGRDWISAGAGTDGVIGDDGRIYTSRVSDQFGESLYNLGPVATEDLNLVISTPGDFQQATINLPGQLKKTVNLTPFNPSEDPGFDARYMDDIIFGGLGDDFLHGGSGDDAMSGAEALDRAYVELFPDDGTTDDMRTDGIVVEAGFLHPLLLADVEESNGGAALHVLGFNALRANEFAAYDEFFPRTKILVDGQEFLLNFAAGEGTAAGTDANGNPLFSDGNDRIFGDLGNDWVVGGTGNDRMYGGYGNDLLNADDNHETGNGENLSPDGPAASYEDVAFGGAGRDVLIANTGGDRLIDWVGEFNSYIVPFAPMGPGTISRALQPQLFEYLYALSANDGADPTRASATRVDPATLVVVNDTGADPARNGEPYGELGLVAQKDMDWREQSGAPDDPQPGNIPGGPRDTMRSANFNLGTADAFAPDSGRWVVTQGRLEVSPEMLGGDAVSVFNVNDWIPSYFEVTATINAGKPTGGLKSNAYLIFDYQSPTDFKFAGVNISTDKLEIGYRDASGWHVVNQANAQLRADRDYSLLLSVNGSAVTLVIDGKKIFAHGFPPRTDADGFVYGLNTGMVGIGANNSIARIDNVAVQVLPPDITLELADDFSDGSADIFSGGVYGSWQVLIEDAGTYLRGTSAGTDFATIGTGFNIGAAYVARSEVTLSTDALAGIVFDQYGEDDFKFAAIDVANDRILIGHHTVRSGWVVDAVTSRDLTPGQLYTLNLEIKGTTVDLKINGQAGISHAFNAVAVDGDIGLITRGGQARFTTVSFSTNDPAYTPAENLLAAALPGALDGAVLDRSSLDATVAAAAVRLAETLVLDGLAVARLNEVDFEIVDLDGGKLAERNGNTILVDIDAAGHGWFLDATPYDDSEFSSAGGSIMVAIDAEAVGRMDLLSVISHELGHVLGLHHDDAADDGDLMSATLAPGVRLLAANDLESTVSGVTFDAQNATPNVLLDRVATQDGKEVRYVARQWRLGTALREMLYFDDRHGSFELVTGLEDGVQTAYKPVPGMDGWLIGEQLPTDVAESGGSTINWDAPVLQRPLDVDDTDGDRRGAGSEEESQGKGARFNPLRILDLYRRVIGE